MKRLVKIQIQGVVEVDDISELKEAIEDTIFFGDIDVDFYSYQDCGELEEE